MTDDEIPITSKPALMSVIMHPNCKELGQGGHDSNNNISGSLVVLGVVFVVISIMIFINKTAGK